MTTSSTGLRAIGVTVSWCLTSVIEYLESLDRPLFTDLTGVANELWDQAWQTPIHIRDWVHTAEAREYLARIGFAGDTLYTRTMDGEEYTDNVWSEDGDVWHSVYTLCAVESRWRVSYEWELVGVWRA